MTSPGLCLDQSAVTPLTPFSSWEPSVLKWKVTTVSVQPWVSLRRDFQNKSSDMFVLPPSSSVSSSDSSLSTALLSLWPGDSLFQIISAVSAPPTDSSMASSLDQRTFVTLVLWPTYFLNLANWPWGQIVRIKREKSEWNNTTTNNKLLIHHNNQCLKITSVWLNLSKFYSTFTDTIIPSLCACQLLKWLSSSAKYKKFWGIFIYVWCKTGSWRTTDQV